MKKLTNVSPFLLLLVPVFMVMLFALTVSGNNTNEEVVAKTTTGSKTASIVKAATVILK